MFPSVHEVKAGFLCSWRVRRYVRNARLRHCGRGHCGEAVPGRPLRRSSWKSYGAVTPGSRTAPSGTDLVSTTPPPCESPSAELERKVDDRIRPIPSFCCTLLFPPTSRHHVVQLYQKRADHDGSTPAGPVRGWSVA